MLTSILKIPLNINCKPVTLTDLKGGHLTLRVLLYTTYPTLGYVDGFWINTVFVILSDGLFVNVSATNLDNPIRLAGIVVSSITPFHTGHVLFQLIIVQAVGSMRWPKSVSSCTCQHAIFSNIHFNRINKFLCYIAISLCDSNIEVTIDVTIEEERNNLVLRYIKLSNDKNKWKLSVTMQFSFEQPLPHRPNSWAISNTLVGKSARQIA